MAKLSSSGVGVSRSAEYHRPTLAGSGVVRRHELSLRFSRGFVTESSTERTIDNTESGVLGDQIDATREKGQPIF